MRLIALILLLFISNLTFGQKNYAGIYKSHFSESIELKADSSFMYKWRFDLSSSWTNGKWKIKKDTIYLKTELIMDTLSIRDSANKIIKDSLVISSDQKINRIEFNEFIGYQISGGGQNREKPPNKLFWKKGKLYRINENGSLDQRKVKSIGTGKKMPTYFINQSD